VEKVKAVLSESLNMTFGSCQIKAIIEIAAILSYLDLFLQRG
jgi:hypothetical protein